VQLDRDKVRRDFAAAVNMGADELKRWLQTVESCKVGFKGSDGMERESIGHASGRRIVEILGRGNDAPWADDYAHMRKVVGYIARHSAQGPQNIFTPRWRYSLMNWGYDPLKEDQC